MQKVNYTPIDRVFFSSFEEIEHKYQTRFSKHNFKKPPALINYVKFPISS